MRQVRVKIIKVILIFLVLIIPSGLLLWRNYRPSSTSVSNNLQSPEITATPCPTDENNQIIQISQLPTSTPCPTISISPPRESNLPSIISTPTAKPTITRPPSPTPTVFVMQPEINIGNTSKKQIAFTFDGGAGTQSMQKILNTLQKHNVKGTFFVTGDWAYKNQGWILEMSNKGHEIFNHTYTHPYLTKIPDDQIITEFKRTEDLIVKLTGKSTKPYFRAPYGDRNTRVLEVAGRQGYRSIYWTVDALDWKESEGYTAEQVKQRIYSNQRNGAIVLMHIGDNITGQILDEVFTKIIAEGYQPVSLTQAL
jgi:peptidoglycan-N-acetylglucosamine deacetylase